MLVNLMIEKLKHSKVNPWFVPILVFSLVISQGSALVANAEKTKSAIEKLDNLPYITLQTHLVNKINQAHISASEMALIAEKHPIAEIEFKSEWGSYFWPVNVVDYDDMAKKLKVELSELILQATIEKVELDILAAWKDKLGNAQLVSPLLQFKLELEANGKKSELTDDKGRYISKTIVLQDQMDITNLTAVALDEETGKITFVPAIFREINGRLSARISSPYESLFGVIRYHKSFEDLNQHWAKQDIELLASKQVMEGVTSSRFEPNSEMSTEQFTVLLMRALGLNNQAGAAIKAQIVGDNGEGSLEGEAQMTREQVAVMLFNALKFTNHTVNLRERADLILTAFTDTDLIDSRAIPALEQAVDTGIMRGKTRTRLAPGEPVTRAEVAVMLKRFMQFVHFID